jgi:site-specific DNA-methyltransferase (cytosine-N4-specific)
LPADHPDKAKEIGSEPTPAAFVDVLLAVTAELRRVLAPHGSIAVELGDTYSGKSGWGDDLGNERYPNGRGVGGLRPDASGEGWPLAKSKALIPELFRIALAYGVNPLTGQPSPAGQWRVRNVVTWCRANPPVGALGDKWRPATSDVVVACVSSKRYWDDLATRGPLSERRKADSEGVRVAHGKNGQEERGDTAWHTLGRYDPSQSAGAPLLDWWSITAGGYPGSHYAVFPSALVEPLVKAMAPPRVCRTCGEPSRRIVENQRDGYGGSYLVKGNPSRNDNGASHFPTADYSTIGWTDCGHGSIVCRSCKGLVPYDHALQRPRSTQEIQGGVGPEEVLGESFEGSGGQEEASSDMRGLRSGLPGADPSNEDMQPILFGETGAYSPPERDQDGQPHRELGDSGSRQASGSGDLSELRDGVPPPLDGYVCPCGSTDLKYVADHYRPALVLDPFAGSGTTLSVATGHGHDAIGFDLDPRNADLALDRVGPLLLEVQS